MRKSVEMAQLVQTVSVSLKGSLTSKRVFRDWILRMLLLLRHSSLFSHGLDGLAMQSNEDSDSRSPRLFAFLRTQLHLLYYPGTCHKQ